MRQTTRTRSSNKSSASAAGDTARHPSSRRKRSSAIKPMLLRTATSALRIGGLTTRKIVSASRLRTARGIRLIASADASRSKTTQPPTRRRRKLHLMSGTAKIALANTRSTAPGLLLIHRRFERFGKNGTPVRNSLSAHSRLLTSSTCTNNRRDVAFTAGIASSRGLKWTTISRCHAEALTSRATSCLRACPAIGRKGTSFLTGLCDVTFGLPQSNRPARHDSDPFQCGRRGACACRLRRPNRLLISPSPTSSIKRVRKQSKRINSSLWTVSSSVNRKSASLAWSVSKNWKVALMPSASSNLIRRARALFVL